MFWYLCWWHLWFNTD